MKSNRFVSKLFCTTMGILFFSALLFCAKFYAKKQPYLKLPVQFLSPLDDALVNVEIGGYPYLLHVDLGSTEMLTLQSKYLKKIKNKKFIKKSKFTNIKWITYETKNYSIPSIKIKNTELKNINLSTEINTDCCTFTRSEAIKNRMNKRKMLFIDGVIGRPIFTRFDCFFDFPNAEITLATNMSALVNTAGCSLENFVQIPFELDSKGIILSATTDIGERKFLLDTGANISLLRTSVVDIEKAKEEVPGKWLFHSNLFTLNKTDFGGFSFLLFEFTDKISEFDGVLGLDFFKKHAICLDFHDNIAYIQP